MRQPKLSLLVLATILAASLSTHTDRAFAQNQPSTIDIIGVGATILNNWLNPPSRNAEIAADTEIRKAKIAADAEIAKEKLRLDARRGIGTTNPILDKWGVAQVPCAPGLVFINGVTNDTICIQPSKAISAGYYTYDTAKQRLVKNNQNLLFTLKPENARNPDAIIEKVFGFAQDGNSVVEESSSRKPKVGKNLGTWEQQVFPSARKSTATNRRNSNQGF